MKKEKGGKGERGCNVPRVTLRECTLPCDEMERMKVIHSCERKVKEKYMDEVN